MFLLGVRMFALGFCTSMLNDYLFEISLTE